MTTHKLNKIVSLLAFGLMNFNLTVHAQEQAKRLPTGDYILEIYIPALGNYKTQSTGDLKFGDLKSGGATFTYQIKVPIRIQEIVHGKLFGVHGKLVGERVVMWMTKEEGGNLLTYHLTGELPKETKETKGRNIVWSGKVSLFTKHGKRGTGKWELMSNK